MIYKSLSFKIYVLKNLINYFLRNIYVIIFVGLFMLDYVKQILIPNLFPT